MLGSPVPEPCTLSENGPLLVAQAPVVWRVKVALKAVGSGAEFETVWQTATMVGLPKSTPLFSLMVNGVPATTVVGLGVRIGAAESCPVCSTVKLKWSRNPTSSVTVEPGATPAGTVIDIR